MQGGRCGLREVVRLCTVSEAIGKEVVERQGRAVYPGPALSPLRPFKSCQVLVADIGVAVKRERPAELRNFFLGPFLKVNDNFWTEVPNI